MRMGMALGLGAIRAGFQKNFLAALMPDGTSRVAAIYTDPANPSYSECIAQNRKALGPELVTGGWATASGFDNTTTQLSVNSFSAVAGTSPTRVAARIGAGSAAGKTSWLAFRVTQLPAVGVLGVYARGVGALDPLGSGTSYASLTNVGSLGWHFLQLTVPTPYADILFVAGSGAQNYAVDGISVRDIADWSQLVLFDDYIGTVPIFSVLQTQRTRGWLMDRSFGMVRGPSFTVETVQLNSNTDHGDGTYTAITGNPQVRFLYPLAQMIPNVWCEVQIQVVSIVGTPVWTVDWCDSFPFSAPVVAGQTICIKQPPRAYDNTFRFLDVTVAGAGSSVRFRVLSVKPLPGAHMSQPTAAARGEFSARVNGLGRSTGNLMAAPEWGGTGMAGTLQPDGSTLLKRNTTAASAYSSSTGTYPVGTLLRVRAEVKKGSDGNLYGLRIQGTYPDRVDVVLNLDTGVLSAPAVTNFAETSASVTALSDGWFLVELVGRATTNLTTAAALVHGPARAGSTGGWEGSSATLIEVYVRKPELRMKADAISALPAYQEMRSTTDYDAVDFPVYHRSQTDDWARAYINPNGATKALIMWAGQKLSETISGMVVEASVNVDTNPGTVRLTVPASSGGQELGALSKGTFHSAVSFTGVTALDTPARLWVQYQSSISQDISKVEANGFSSQDLVTDQGTGTYLPYDYYFGARAGTSLYMNVEEFAPPLLMFLQPNDSIPLAYLNRLKEGYARAAGVPLS